MNHWSVRRGRKVTHDMTWSSDNAVSSYLHLSGIISNHCSGEWSAFKPKNAGKVKHWKLTRLSMKLQRIKRTSAWVSMFQHLQVFPLKLLEPNIRMYISGLQISDRLTACNGITQHNLFIVQCNCMKRQSVALTSYVWLKIPPTWEKDVSLLYNHRPGGMQCVNLNLSCSFYVVLIFLRAVVHMVFLGWVQKTWFKEWTGWLTQNHSWSSCYISTVNDNFRCFTAVWLYGFVDQFSSPVNPGQNEHAK